VFTSIMPVIVLFTPTRYASPEPRNSVRVDTRPPPLCGCAMPTRWAWTTRIAFDAVVIRRDLSTARRAC